MCGLAGFLEQPGGGPPSRARTRVLTAMGARLAHRGPDGEARYDDGTLGLAFRRLAIIDLETGAQPIWNEDRSCFVALNGEIYNHQDLRRTLAPRHVFRTGSDAEVVLHLFEEHGLEALPLLQGMFSLAIWEPAAPRLLLARDRLGIKPLYVARTPSTLLFASELKALLAHPACPREVAWHEVDPDPAGGVAHLPTYVSGVEQLPGGSWLLADDAGTRTGRYWNIEDSFGRQPASRRPADLVDEYAALFDDAARRHLMSDVPVGAFLSGGIDSAMVVAASAAHASAPLHCFHALHQTTYQSGDADAAVALARAVGQPLHLVPFTQAPAAIARDFSLERFEHLVWLLDSPRLNAEFFFKHELHRYAKTVQPDLKVMLLGQGADEFCGGYSRYYTGPHQSWAAYLDGLRAGERRERLAASRLPHAVSTLMRDLPACDRGRTPESVFHREMQRRVQRLQHYNLWHEDRTAAGQGVESRVPFLDHRLVELLAGIPVALQPTLFWDKRLIRDVARRLLPAALVDRPKIGFYWTHDTSSIDALMRALVTRVFPAFRDKYLADADAIFDADAMTSLAATVRAGGRRGAAAQPRLLTAMASAIFERQCRTAAAPPPAPGRPSPLRAVPPSELRRLGPRRDDAIPAWTTRRRVRLEPGTRVLRGEPSSPGTTTLVRVAADLVERELDVAPDTAWIVDLLTSLGTSRHGITVAALRRRFARHRHALDDALTVLCADGWIGPVDGPEPRRPGRSTRRTVRPRPGRRARNERA